MREKKRANLCDDARNARNVRAGMREVARRCENVRGIQLKIPGKSASRGSSCNGQEEFPANFRCVEGV